MINGKIVNLIPFDRKYIEDVRRWRLDPNVYKTLFTCSCISDYNQEAWYEKTMSDSSKLYMIIQDRATEKAIGIINLCNIDRLNLKADLGFYIGDMNHRNGGHSVEAVYLLMKYSFEFLNFNKICGYVLGDNKKVISMHKRFKFQQEGVLKRHIYNMGEYKDVVIMGMFKEDYFENKEGFQKIFDIFEKKI